jgi:hypothetical protein
MSETIVNPDKFKQLLSKYFDEDENKISNILKECNAIISGGCILSAHYDTPVNDIDIYVNLANAQKLYTSLTNFRRIIESDIYNSIVPPYDSSFMAKNHILGRQQLKLNYSIHIDFMIVEDDTPITDVPKNFDLTFCMNWYDGTNLIYMYPDHVIEKRGYLAEDYYSALLKGNAFTIKRLKKYTERNYIINYPTKTPTKSMVFTLNEKKVISPDIWVTTMILRYIIINTMIINNYSNLITYLYILRRIQLETGSTSLFNYNNIVTMLTVFYTKKIEALAEDIDDDPYPYSWDIPTILNIIICTPEFGLGMCGERYEDKYIKYIEDVTGARLYSPTTRNDGTTDETPTRGVNGTKEYTPMCTGEIPPFSRGINNIPMDADILDYIREAYTGIINHDDLDINIIVRRTYPKLYIKILQQTMRQSAQNMAIMYGTGDEDEIEDIDDYIIPGTNKSIPARCFNTIEGGDINTSSWYPTKENILFSIEFYPGADIEIVCTSLKELEISMKNQSTVMYKCSGNSGYKAGTDIPTTLEELGDGENMDIGINNVDLSISYIQFTYGVDTNSAITGYLPESQVKSIIQETNDGNVTKIYDLVFVDTISHTASKLNTPTGTEPPNYISTNHCQAGSSILVYKVTNFN